MLRRLRFLVAFLALFLCLAPAAPAGAVGFNIFKGACTNPVAKSSPACQTDGSDPITGKNGIIYKVNQILAIVGGVAAVIMIMVGGLMHITAGGDANRAKTARTVIISAVIGLIVIAMAEVFIALVINLVD